MNDFDIKNFLTENKMTRNCRLLSEDTWSAKLYGTMPGSSESEMVEKQEFSTKEEAEAFISGKEGTWDIEYNFTDDQLNALDQYEKTGLYPEEMSDEEGDYIRDLWRSEQGYEDFTDPSGGSGLDSHV